VEIYQISYAVNKSETASSTLHKIREAIKENDIAHSDSRVGNSAAQRANLNVAVQNR
jgi:hypothetical protein